MARSARIGFVETWPGLELTLSNFAHHKRETVTFQHRRIPGPKGSLTGDRFARYGSANDSFIFHLQFL